MTLKNKFHYSDNGIPLLGMEEIPNEFTVYFTELTNKSYPEVKVTISDMQAGDIINDNSHDDDGYRYHDIFHYTFATMLHWSPCTRAMLKRKRKSDEVIDRIEDGARAIITEEAISLILFNDAKSKNFYRQKTTIDKNLLILIKKMTSPFEVKDCTEKDWEQTILKAYEIFRKLKSNKGGVVKFNTLQKTIDFQLK